MTLRGSLTGFSRCRRLSGQSIHYEKLIMRQFCEMLSFVRHKISIPVLLLLSLSLFSCDSSDNAPVQRVDSADRLSDAELQQLQQQPAEKSSGSYSFGFDLRASPQEDVAQYLPFLNYLEAATGYHFDLHFTPKDSTAADELGENRTQFAAMGANGFLHAQSHYEARSLVRGLNQAGKAEYRSFFVVRPDSPVRNIADIKGRKLAFGSRDSTQGHLIPRIMLSENGISLDDLHAYDYMGSHQNCVEAVVSGHYDVCGMQDQLAEKLASENLVKIIHRSRYYPSSGIVVSKAVPDEVVARVRQALLDFDPQGKDAKDLYHWERTEMARGFIASQQGDYDDLRRWFSRLGFLHEHHAQEQIP